MGKIDEQVTEQDARKQWEEAGYDPDKFNFAYSEAAGSADTPNAVAWAKMMGSYSSVNDMMGVMGTEVPEVDYIGIYEAMSKMNKEKFEEYWPKSIEEGIKAGKQYDIAGQEQAMQASAFNMQLADQMNNWLTNLTRYGNIFMREEAGKSNEWIKGQVSDINKFNSDEFYNALETAMPGIMGTAQDYKKTVDQMLSGQLPEDVKSMITQTAAERGLSQGVYGPSYNAASLRDLGLNSLQMMQAGQAQMPTLMGVTAGITAPLATPNIYQNVMMQPTLYTPAPAYQQPVNIPGIAGNYLAAIMGSTMMQPQAGVQAGLQAAQLQSQVQMANTQLQYAQATGMMNWQNQQQMMDLYRQSIRAQQQNAMWGGIGSIGSGLLQAVGSWAGGGWKI